MLDGLKNPDECMLELQRLQGEHEKVLNVMMQISDHLPELKKKVRGYLREHYKQAFDETRSNAGQETLELWAGSKIGKEYDEYVCWNERFEEMKRISDAYLGNISSVQSRLSFYRNL